MSTSEENTLSDIDTLKLTLRGMTDLGEMTDYLTKQYKVAELEEIATEAGVDAPASTKAAIAEQIIAKLTSDEDANVSPDPSESEDEIVSPDEASSGQGVLPEEGRGVGVSLPAKVAAMPPERLWPEILGWEISQGLDEDARAAFSDDELREYLGYLWHMGALGRAPVLWQTIEEYFSNE